MDDIGKEKIVDKQIGSTDFNTNIDSALKDNNEEVNMEDDNLPIKDLKTMIIEKELDQINLKTSQNNEFKQSEMLEDNESKNDTNLEVNKDNLNQNKKVQNCSLLTAKDTNNTYIHSDSKPEKEESHDMKDSEDNQNHTKECLPQVNRFLYDSQTDEIVRQRGDAETVVKYRACEGL